MGCRVIAQGFGGDLRHGRGRQVRRLDRERNANREDGFLQGRETAPQVHRRLQQPMERYRIQQDILSGAPVGARERQWMLRGSIAKRIPADLRRADHQVGKGHLRRREPIGKEK